ncbi:MAG: hypothetical protein U0802_17860 [Candidatus Binatia bacterium]
MRGRRIGGALLLGAMVASTADVARAVVIGVGSVAGAPGDVVSIDVGLSSQGSAVLATQNRIDFTRQAFVAARGDGAPDCAVNPAIDKNATAFRFLPLGCDPDVDCASVRVFVLAFDNLDPIADGARLYTCQVRIADGAADGSYPLTNGEVGSSAAGGVLLPTSGTSGAVTVVRPPAARVLIGDAEGLPGETVQVDATLSLLTPAAEVAGVQLDFSFDPATPVAATPSGRPDCTVNSQLGAGGQTFTFLPMGCAPGDDCRGVRAFVFSLVDPQPIADGTLLFSCALRIGADTPAGVYPLVAGDASGSDPAGGIVPVLGADGAITVDEPPPPPACAGDCDGGGEVSINELLLGVNILVGNAGVGQCPAADSSGDGSVTVNELVQAVNAALVGCPR